MNLFKTIAYVFFALSLIVVGDTAGKIMTAGGMDPFFVAWSRFFIAIIFLLPLSGVKIKDLALIKDWRVLLRAALIIGGISSILTALKTEPIANVFGAFFIGPIVAYLLSTIVLKEKTNLLRSILLTMGFIGVLLVVKPGFGLTIGLGFALLAGSLHGAYIVATRWLANDYGARALLMSQLLIGSILLAPIVITEPLPDFDLNVFILIMLSAFGSAFGNYMLVIASKTTPANLMAPLIYTQLIAATIAGILVFAEWPDFMTLIGLVVILASGLLSLVFSKR